MTSFGEYTYGGTLKCKKLIADEFDVNITVPSLTVDEIKFDKNSDKWKIYLDAANNFIIENQLVNVISLSGDAHTGKISLYDFNLEDLANVVNTDKIEGSVMYYDAVNSLYKFTTSLTNDLSLGDLPDVVNTDKVAGSVMYYDASDSLYKFTDSLTYNSTNWELSGVPLQFINTGDIRIYNGAIDGNIFIGDEVRTNPHNYVIAMGYRSGRENLGDYSLALGFRASNDGGNHDHTIVLNATGSNLNPQQADSTYIKPIRNVEPSNLSGLEFLYYNEPTGELTRSNFIIGRALNVGIGDITGGAIVGSSLNVVSGDITGGAITGTGLNIGTGSITCGAISGSALNVGTGDITCNVINANQLYQGANKYITLNGSGIEFATGDPNFYITMFNNEINQVSNGIPSDMYLNYNGGNVHIGKNGTTSRIFLNGLQINSSDNRLKHNESDISGLAVIRQLLPQKYQKTDVKYAEDYNGDISDEWHWETGFIAQDVLQIGDISYCVHHNNVIKDDVETDLFGLNYKDIFVFNVQATKELDEKITALEQSTLTNIDDAISPITISLDNTLTNVNENISTKLNAPIHIPPSLVLVEYIEPVLITGKILTALDETGLVTGWANDLSLNILHANDLHVMGNATIDGNVNGLYITDTSLNQVTLASPFELKIISQPHPGLYDPNNPEAGNEYAMDYILNGANTIKIARTTITAQDVSLNTIPLTIPNLITDSLVSGDISGSSLDLGTSGDMRCRAITGSSINLGSGGITCNQITNSTETGYINMTAGDGNINISPNLNVTGTITASNIRLDDRHIKLHTRTELYGLNGEADFLTLTLHDYNFTWKTIGIKIFETHCPPDNRGWSGMGEWYGIFLHKNHSSTDWALYSDTNIINVYGFRTSYIQISYTTSRLSNDQLQLKLRYKNMVNARTIISSAIEVVGINSIY